MNFTTSSLAMWATNKHNFSGNTETILPKITYLAIQKTIITDMYTIPYLWQLGSSYPNWELEVQPLRLDQRQGRS